MDKIITQLEDTITIYAVDELENEQKKVINDGEDVMNSLSQYDQDYIKDYFWEQVKSQLNWKDIIEKIKKSTS